MRSAYLVAYDVADEKRLRKTYSIMRGFGDALQYSVFYCQLSALERQRLKEVLWDLLDFDLDRVMVVDLGPTEGRGSDCIEFWGQPRELTPDRNAVIV